MEISEKNISDQFGRIHDYLRISLTERCNLRCFYCMPEEGIALRPKSQFMTKEEVIRMAETFVSLGIKKIRLTGGEPLVRNDAKEIIDALSGLPVELAITTNGILVNKYIDTFISSGLKSVNVSLDSLQRDKLNSITRRNYFDTIISNIRLLIKNNFHVKLNAVIIRGVNDDEIVDFIEFTKDNNVHFRFIEFMPFDGNKWDWSKGLSYKEILDMVKLKYRNNLTRMEDRKNDTSRNFRVHGYKGTFAIISSVTNPFCGTCNRIRLTADGKIKNCLFSDSETDLLSAMRREEDIIPMIQETVWHKKSMRGGMNSIEDFGKQKNRSMVAIGG
ncbi:MAG: GTP 3',8-cyclase MoaA [Bacteroidetes bacterium]|nr:MAG: GTP 3',8-cyclase MoaA [Bacteroidota bacterium]